MEKAYEYRRISQKDQSNWSLAGQGDTNARYAERYGFQIVKSYIDDGKSAKDFNRPEWKKLLTEIRKSGVKYVIITKYDRLIRNTAQGLAMLQNLEDKHGIRILSAMEHIGLNPMSPHFFKFRADLLVNAEYERRIISDRSKFGVWQAKKSGRYVGRAPYGFVNKRDRSNKPIIERDLEKADIMATIYQAFFQQKLGYKITLKLAREAGYSQTGHGALKRTLLNSLCYGLVLVPAYSDNKAEIVQSKCEGWWPEHLYYEAKEQLETKTRRRYSVDEDLPLRGYVLCSKCNQLLTGAKSRGTGGLYGYYKCNKCKGVNHSAKQAHMELEEILSTLSYSEEYSQRIYQKVMNKIEERMSSRKKRLDEVEHMIKQHGTKLHGLEEKYISGNLADETFRKWNGILRRDIAGLETEKTELTSDYLSIIQDLEASLKQLQDLNYLYQSASVTKKQYMLKLLFGNSLIKISEGYRTNYINPIFMDNYQKTNLLTLENDNGILDKNAQNPVSTRSGNRTRTAAMATGFSYHLRFSPLSAKE